MTPLLELRNVTKTFQRGVLNRQQTVALEDFSFVVNTEPASITAVVGESGSGKTTLARLLLGVAAPSAGSVLYNGKDLRTLTALERRTFRREVQVIFQDPFDVYNPFYQVDHVLEVPIDKFGLAHSRQEKRGLVEQALKTVGLRPEETLGRYPHQLSGGQRQRIMVARALLLKPKLIIADEPASMIDASSRATVLANLRQLNQEFGISFIYITHDLTTAYQISQNIIVLYAGSVAEMGDVELVVNQPHHPYTKLLIGSIPLPDPTRHWNPDAQAAQATAAGPKSAGCKFAPRCPYVMPKCWSTVPPLYRTDPGRFPACFLYETAPAVTGAEIALAFANLPSPASVQPS
jgi:oligopeptide/dipeptide ABC transporter ATP-binding protein